MSNSIIYNDTRMLFIALLFIFTVATVVTVQPKIVQLSTNNC